MLIIPSKDVSPPEVLKEVWSTVQECNERLPAYAQLAPEMVYVLPVGLD